MFTAFSIRRSATLESLFTVSAKRCGSASINTGQDQISASSYEFLFI
jgi:hypothetical protein